MTDNISIRDQLKADNPFLSVASPLPWENKIPDTSQLNSATSDDIEQLIRDKRREPSLPLSGLIFGGQGMGKTHMLTRILRRLRKNAWHAIFVNVKTLTNPKRIIQELLSEICICLNKIHSNGISQFDMLKNEMMNVYHERRAEEGLAVDDVSHLKVYLKHDMPEMNKIFLKCLLLYVGTSDKAVKLNIIEWLRQGLDDEDCLALGLPMRDVYSMDDAACESAAEDIIMSLGILLDYAHVTMIVCFDELDGMKDKRELVEAFGYAVGFLMNTTSGILPLCFVKTDTWNNVLHPVLNPAIIQRMKTNTMNMKGCSVEQAKQLIHDRISSTFSDGVEEKYNWLISQMSGTIIPGLSPRSVIELAKKAIDIGESNPIKEIYDESYKKVQTEPRAWPPNTDLMVLAATTWLTSHSGCEVHGTWGKHIKVLATFGDKHIALAMPVPKTAPTATAAVNECFKFIKEYPDSFCCYIKENKSHKSTWKAFAHKLEEFSDTSCGHALELDEESRITWYALAATINQINNGNVNIYSTSGSRTATLDDARDFIRSIDLVPGLFSSAKPSPDTPKPLKPQPPIIIVEPDVLKVNLLSVLKSSPMKVISIDKALTLLEGRKIRVTRNELLNFLSANKNTFRTYTSTNDVMIGAATK